MEPVIKIVYNVEKDIFEGYCRDKIVTSQHTLLKCVTKLAKYVKGNANAK